MNYPEEFSNISNIITNLINIYIIVLFLLANDNAEERYTLEPGTIRKDTAATIYGDINEAPEFRLSVDFGPTP